MRSGSERSENPGFLLGAFRQACSDAARSFPFALVAYAALVIYLHSPWGADSLVVEGAVHGAMTLIAVLAFLHCRHVAGGTRQGAAYAVRMTRDALAASWQRARVIRPADRIKLVVAAALLAVALRQDASLLELAMLVFALVAVLTKRVPARASLMLGLAALLAAAVETVLGGQKLVTMTAVFAFEFLCVGCITAVLELKSEKNSGVIHNFH